MASTTAKPSWAFGLTCAIDAPTIPDSMDYITLEQFAQEIVAYLPVQPDFYVVMTRHSKMFHTDDMNVGYTFVFAWKESNELELVKDEAKVKNAILFVSRQVHGR
jgi:hypothetical protein